MLKTLLAKSCKDCGNNKYLLQHTKMVINFGMFVGNKIFNEYDVNNHNKVKEFFLTDTGATSYSISDLNIDTLIDYNPLIMRSGSSVRTDVEKPYFYNISTDMCRIFVRDNSTIEVRYQIGSSYTSTKVRCVLEYTKITD